MPEGVSKHSFVEKKSEKIVSKIYFENKEIELQELIKQSLNKL